MTLTSGSDNPRYTGQALGTGSEPRPALDAALAKHLRWARTTFAGQTATGQYFHLRGECQELLDAGTWDEVAAELADVVIAGAIWADLVGLDLAQVVAKKAAGVRQRNYRRQPDGSFDRARDGSDDRA
jgi:NTP pyrophosphatase (non-canonical NTP hydrolase)